jgi:hypothetical protein
MPIRTPVMFSRREVEYKLHICRISIKGDLSLLTHIPYVRHTIYSVDLSLLHTAIMYSSTGHILCLLDI